MDGQAIRTNDLMGSFETLQKRGDYNGINQPSINWCRIPSIVHPQYFIATTCHKRDENAKKKKPDQSVKMGLDPH